MPWVYSTSSTNYYTWTGTNTYNQHAAAVSIPTGAVTKLKVYAAGYGSSVSTRLVLWNSGGSVRGQSATFTMAAGSLSVGGQAWHEKSLSSAVSVSSGTYWVGLYRNPSGGHIFGTNTSGSGYRRTNTSGFPNCYSMSSYNTDGTSEPYVGAFYITSPADVSSISVNDSKKVSWSNNSTTDRPYTNLYVQRSDNEGSYSTKASLSGSSTSWTDTGTSTNKKYRWRVYASNAAGNSGYEYTNYLKTTPSTPTSVVAVRNASNVDITWTNNADWDDNVYVERNTSSDGVTWAGWSAFATLSGGATSDQDTSPANFNQYRVRTFVNNTSPVSDIYSSYGTSNIVQTLQAPDPPSGLSPASSETVDVDEAQLFSWTHNPLDGSSQTKYSLRYRIQGNSWPGTPQYDEVSGTDNFVSIAASTFTTDEVYEWQVATWGDYATGSDWSDTATFVTSTKPVPTFTDPVDSGVYAFSALEVDWDYDDDDANDQASYICKLYNSEGILLETQEESSIISDGGSDTATFDYDLVDGETYTITLQVSDSTGLWSDEISATFSVGYAVPVEPIISLTADNDNASVLIEITNPTYVNTMVISDCEATDNWASLGWDNSTGGTFAAETTIVNEGSQSSKMTADASAKGIHNVFSSTLDLTEYEDAEESTEDDYISFDIYITTQDKTDMGSANLTIAFHMDSLGTTTNYYYYDISAADLTADAWTTIQVPKEDFTEVGTGDWSACIGMSLSLDAAPTAEVIAYIDNINLVEFELETSYNEIWRNDVKILDNVPLNTIVTDYTPNIGNVSNEYYAKAVSALPSKSQSETESISLDLKGQYYINSGPNYSSFFKFIYNTSLAEDNNTEQQMHQFAGRTYPVKYQDAYKQNEGVTFSAWFENTYDNLTLVRSILNYIGNTYYRDYMGRSYQCAIYDISLTKEAKGQFMILSCKVIRVEGDSDGE